MEITIPRAQRAMLYLEMLKRHVPYAETLYQSYPEIPGAGFFHSGTSRENGIRSIANYIYHYAFLLAKCDDQSFAGVTRHDMLECIRSSLRYLVNTHVEIGKFTCVDGKKWGMVWQSSMWTAYACMGAWLVWKHLDKELQAQIGELVAIEADRIASIPPPFGEWSDTKAEENGWDSNIVALARSMFPTHPRALQWDETARLYMLNTLSLEADLQSETIVNGRKLGELVKGANLHPDFTMENHDIFHPVYQMVVYNEFGFSAFCYLYGGLTPPDELKHHVLETWNQVLKKIILPEGEWLYPNGLDWMIHDYEHLASIAFIASYFQDPSADLHEGAIAYYAMQRQKQQQDGSFFGKLVDLGPLRESVAAQRLVDACLFHEYFARTYNAAQDLNMAQFVREQSGSSYFSYTKILLHRNEAKAASFSWQKKFMGLLVPDSRKRLLRPYVISPYMRSFVGHYEIVGRKNDVDCDWNTSSVNEEGFITTGKLVENEHGLAHYVTFVSLPNNLVVYLDQVYAEAKITMVKECGIPLGIETGGSLCAVRHVTCQEGTTELPAQSVQYPGGWLNFDGALGLAVKGGSGLLLGGDEYSQRGSIIKLCYGSYSADSRSFAAGTRIANRLAVVGANVTPTETALLYEQTRLLALPKGWSGAAVKDLQGKEWLILSHYFGLERLELQLVASIGKPRIVGEKAGASWERLLATHAHRTTAVYEVQ